MKAALIHTEELSAVGRLWDFDVFDANAKQYSRSELALPPRCCLICEQEAKICARQRTHQLSEIISQIEVLANASSHD